MPTPYHCHTCDKPTMNSNMLCDSCYTAYIEGDKAIFATVTSLEERVKWLEDGLNEIKATTKGLLDGNPTTADEHNRVYISDINKEIADEWVNSPNDEKTVYEDEHFCKHGYSKASYCTDCDCESKDFKKSLKSLIEKYPNDQELGNKIRNMVTSLDYRGKD